MINKDKCSRGRNGFTLVELLAVIVILAIILVIAVPKVMSVIEDSKKATLESTAKMIASQAEKQKVQNTVLGNDEAITCEDITNINDVDYASCDIAFDENTAKVTITGAGKFEGLWVCNGTKTSAIAIKGNGCPVNVITHMQNLLAQESKLNNGLKHITVEYTYDSVTHYLDAGIRYVGESPNNYIEFNNEVWRIIGLVDVKTASGSTEKLLKIMRNDKLIDNANFNASYGGWSWNYEDRLKTMLNGYYINNSNLCTYYYSIEGQVNCVGNITPINTTYINMIEEVKWGRGRYNYKLNETLYYEITELEYEIGKVGLIYLADYALASGDVDCPENISNSSSCQNNNWMQYGDKYLTISEQYDWSDEWYSRIVGLNGPDVGGSAGVRPVVYLKSNVKITGKGTNDSNIFKLSS